MKSPQLFTEKIQWLKLYDRKERYIELVDKVLVKEYIRKKIDASIIVPTLGIWNSVDEIHFEDIICSRNCSPCRFFGKNLLSN